MEGGNMGCVNDDLGEALARNLERLQFVVQSALDAIILWDENGTIVFWNKGAHTMFGYAEAEAISKPLTLIIPTRYHKAHFYGMELVGAGGKGGATVKTLELHGLRKNGEEFPIEMSPSKSVLAEKTFYCGIIRDISERKHAERALEERNRLLAFEVAVGDVLNQRQPLGAILQGCAGTIVRHLNLAWVGIWTLSDQNEGLKLQAHGGTCRPIIGSEDPEKFGHFEIGKIAYEKKPFLTNAALEDPRVPNQSWVKQEGLVGFAGYPLLSKQEVVGVLAIFSRIPLSSFTMHSLQIVVERIATAIDRYQAMEAHQSLARHNERILASSGEGIYGLDIEGKLTFVNPAGAHMLGYRMENLVGESMHELIHHTKPDGSPYPREDCPLNAALQKGAVFQSETEMLWRKDGTSFPVNCSISPIVEDGQRTGAVVTFQDISERLRMTAELLEQTKLAGVTMILGDISHDIKNMLMPVLNGAKLLDEELLEHYANLSEVTPKQVVAIKNFSREAIDMIVKNARRIQGRMREIADTVKGISSPLRFTACQVSEVVKAVFENLRFYATEKGVSLHIQGLDALPPIHADENRLFNALYNLVNNAIPETPVGGSVTVTGAVGSDRTTVVISVIDTGKGMSLEIRDSLFTKGAISGKAGGTGLGTKIVKDVVDAHGGVITVDSEQGKGTTFTIHIPINPQTDDLAE
jgi:PAS domain S-box-containing protein